MPPGPQLFSWLTQQSSRYCGSKQQQDTWNNSYSPFPHAQALPLWQKAAAGLTAGGLGALVGSPADLTLIRMQADSTLPMASRRNYKGVGDAMVSSFELLARTW